MGSDIKRKQELKKEYTAARVPLFQKTQKKRHSREEKASEKKLKKCEFQLRRIIQRRERERAGVEEHSWLVTEESRSSRTCSSSVSLIIFVI